MLFWIRHMDDFIIADIHSDMIRDLRCLAAEEEEISFLPLPFCNCSALLDHVVFIVCRKVDAIFLEYIHEESGARKLIRICRLVYRSAVCRFTDQALCCRYQLIRLCRYCLRGCL